MSQDRKLRRGLFEGVKGLALLVDKLLFDAFPYLRERGYREDMTDDAKPLSFAIVDQRLGRLNMMKEMRYGAEAASLMPPFPGLQRVLECERKRKEKVVA